jgi:hypothetical protein
MGEPRAWATCQDEWTASMWGGAVAPADEGHAA